MKRIAINGFGRIGRVLTRLIQGTPNIELVAINDLTDTKTLAHLLKYDSVHGIFNGTIEVEKDAIIINGKKVNVYKEKSPENLPWAALNIDIVVECTGLFLTRELANKHLIAGAKKVLLSAPAKDEDIKTIVIGINEHLLETSDNIISNASCTTNAVAPMIKLLDDNFGIEQANITTVHSYTNDQGLHDAPHKDLRRARAGALSIIPTSTGAAKATIEIFPTLKGKIKGYAIRVPVPDGSLIDVCAIVKKEVSVESINNVFLNASQNGMKHILEYTLDEIVSRDIVGNKNSCIFDANLTSVSGKLVKIVGWYDNEVGYSNRLMNLIGIY
ncbi:MAG: type I glyceraldehyde-3-phosphate dehydrogenase [Vicingaceae bacterium]|nr:type I glyceraldehyde-3-phosphate dehydrogenase [Vicingaceae bacterium]